MTLDLNSFKCASIADINLAICLYYGVDEKIFTIPKNNIGKINKILGEAKTIKIINEIIIQIQQESYDLVTESKFNLESATSMVKKILQERYPDLSKKSIEAFGQNFMFTMK